MHVWVGRGGKRKRKRKVSAVSLLMKQESGCEGPGTLPGTTLFLWYRFVTITAARLQKNGPDLAVNNRVQDLFIGTFLPGARRK